MQKIVSEIVKAQRQLHIAIRDKNTVDLNLQNAMDELKATPKENIVMARQNVADLEGQADKLKNQIDSLKDKIAELTVELKESEAKERANFSKTMIPEDLSLNSSRSLGKTAALPKEYTLLKTQRITSAKMETGEKETTDQFANTLARVF